MTTLPPSTRPDATEAMEPLMKAAVHRELESALRERRRGNWVDSAAHRHALRVLLDVMQMRMEQTNELHPPTA